jgi:hypothetical protein
MHEDPEDWLPEDEEEYGSYDDNYDEENAFQPKEIDLPEEMALDCPTMPVESVEALPGPYTAEDPIDRYCFLYWV